MKSKKSLVSPVSLIALLAALSGCATSGKTHFEEFEEAHARFEKEVYSKRAELQRCQQALYQENPNYPDVQIKVTLILESGNELVSAKAESTPNISKNLNTCVLNLVQSVPRNYPAQARTTWTVRLGFSIESVRPAKTQAQAQPQVRI